MSIVLLKSLAVWFLLVGCAILNGALREKILVPALGVRGLTLSGVILSLVIFGVTWATLPWLGRLTALQYWIVGGVWLALTELFEFGFGHFVEGKSWTELAAAYDLTGGNVWILVLVVTVAAPYFAAKVRGLV